VLVELYTDGTDQASEANQNLELSKFHTVAIPFYAILDADEKPIATFAGSTTDAKETWRSWQRQGAGGCAGQRDWEGLGPAHVMRLEAGIWIFRD